MPTTTAFHDVIDKPSWRPVAPSPSASAAGTCLIGDLRNNEDRYPKLFEFISATVVNNYNIKNDGWTQLASPALTGTFGAGANAIFMPHRGPRGGVSAATTSSITCSTLESIGGTALTVPAMALADRCDGIGFKIRIYDRTAGKTQETYITSNTAGTTPTITFSPVLTWSPTAATTFYEILSGRAYFISSGTTAAGVWKCFDVACSQWSGNLSTTNLPATLGAADSSMICLDELYVPSNQSPGAGIFGNLTATASSTTTITGQASGGDAGVLANEFRNFQIRIISDATTPASVGQRNRITSHTAGPSAVYTMSTTWTTQPSSSAVFVIEYPNDIIYSGSSQTTTYTYFSDAAPGLNSGAATADSWSSTMYGARGTACGAGTYMFCGFGVSNAISTGFTTAALYGTNDPNKNFRYSYLFSWRGGGTNTLDYLDIAGGAAGAWTSATTADMPGGANYFNTGTSCAYDAATMNGQYLYVNYIGGQIFARYNVFARTFDEWAYIRYTTAGAVVGNKMATAPFVDPGGSGPRIGFVYSKRVTPSTTGANTELYESLVSR